MPTDLYINGMFPQFIGTVYDAANTAAGEGGASMVSPSQHSVGAMVLERQESDVGVFVEVYDPEIASILMGEFL